MMYTKEELDAKLREIEQLQQQVADIIYGNWFVRTFYLNKAKKLHKLAQDKIDELPRPPYIHTLAQDRLDKLLRLPHTQIDQ